MNLKKFVGSIHFWFGMITGPIVFVLALTGAIYAFQEEIQDATQPYRFVQKQNKEFLPPSVLIPQANKANPNKHLHALMYHEKSRAVKAIYYSFNEYYDFVYMNPYTGKVLKVHSVQNSFFGFILDGHFYLWLPAWLGQPIVASATLIFFLLLLSGLFLWWPRNKNNKRQKFSIKWKSSWRRKNYDVHSVLGFYVLIFALIFAITGLVWGFEWFRNSYYFVASAGEQYENYLEPKSHQGDSLSRNEILDNTFYTLLKSQPKSGWIELHLPESDSVPIAVNVNPDATTFWKTDYRYFDQKSGKELSVSHQWGRFKNATSSEKLMRMNYDIHVGGIAGLPGKIFACLMSLVIASLPITGFMIWYGRKYKKK
jgi:uncharacterized iron-regulated membrane protein